MLQSEVIGEKFGTRMAAMDIVEYQMGRTRDGEEFVKSFFCDLLVPWGGTVVDPVTSGTLGRTQKNPKRGKFMADIPVWKTAVGKGM